MNRAHVHRKSLRRGIVVGVGDIALHEALFRTPATNGFGIHNEFLYSSNDAVDPANTDVSEAFFATSRYMAIDYGTGVRNERPTARGRAPIHTRPSAEGCGFPHGA